MWNLSETLWKVGLIPVVTLDQSERALSLARALIEGGLPCVEITFRTVAAEESIRLIVKDFPDMLTGAGTVLSVDQAKRAIGAGASYIVSPGFAPSVVDLCQRNGIPVLPGVATPTEILMALGKGINLVKFFPAEALGGARMLDALAAPFGSVKFIPTGGINALNLPNYLTRNSVLACGGSWLATGALLKAGAYAEIARLTREAVDIVADARGQGGKL